MKFGQLIEYKMRNIFLKKLYTKCGGEDSPKSFYKKSKLRIVQLEICQNIFKIRCWPLAFTLYKAFIKQKEVWN